MATTMSSSRTVPRLETDSVKAAYLYGGVLIRTVQPRPSRLLDHRPVDSVFLPKAFEVCSLKLSPILLVLHLLQPFNGHRRKHRRRSLILDVVCQHAALRTRAEPSLIFTEEIHVMRVQGKKCVCRCVVSDPVKCLGPRVARLSPRPLDLGISREQLPLRVEHAETQGHQQQRPAPGTRLKYEFAKQSAAGDNQQDVNERKTAQGLQPGKRFKPGWRGQCHSRDCRYQHERNHRS